MNTEFTELRHRLSKNPRARLLVEKAAAPQNEMRTKNFKLTVKCAADFTRRNWQLEEMHRDILNRNLYAQMPPIDLAQGRFEVAVGSEETFKEIAAEHGFNASEVIECP